MKKKEEKFVNIYKKLTKYFNANIREDNKGESGLRPKPQSNK